MTTDQPDNLENQVSRLENSNIDIRLAVSALIETATQHQLNFEAMERRMEASQAESNRRFEESNRRFEALLAEIQIIKAEIRGLQTENRRILDRVFGPEP